MAKDATFDDIRKNIMTGQFAPVYLFQGEEEYFIDQLTDLLIEKVVPETERDFNQTIFYGADASAAAVINACRRFPMMTDRQLVVLKEAQNMKDREIEELAIYVEKPLASTVLVIGYKHGKLDGRKKLSATTSKKGVVFESKKLYDNNIPAFINSYLKSRQTSIEDKGAQMLTDCLGANISKLVNEIEKLIIGLPENNRRITTTMIEQNIGISKEFNNLELISAIARRDVLKANRIIRYFEQNPKDNPPTVTLSALFNFFAGLMMLHYEKNKTPEAIMQCFGIRSPYDPRIRERSEAVKIYKPLKTMQIISLIRDCDARTKGFGNSSLTGEMLMKELVYKIMH